MTTKPVELVLANTLHEDLSKIETLPEPIRSAAARGGPSRGSLVEGIARSALCRIAHDVPIAVVLRALAAAGAPGTLAEVEARIAAVEDQRRAAGQDATGTEGATS